MEATQDLNLYAKFPSTQVPFTNKFDTGVGLGGNDTPAVKTLATSWGGRV